MQEISHQTLLSDPQISDNYVVDKSVGKETSGLDYLLAGKSEQRFRR